ncbi:MAG: polysaccharide biosynthesis tyrosine autokinase [Rhizonema sp. PD37]|nr:polysaccharide biosynthesis tyrosine autokinase [Rhizonema sp. PD37]
MTPPIVKRYLIAFDKYKWIGLAGFGLVVIGSTVVAVQPESPSYIASGALSYSRPPVSFSLTGTQIQQEGQELSEDILRSESIIEPVAAKENIDPQKLNQNLVIELPQKAKAGTGGDSSPASTLIQLKYQDKDSKRARETLQELMLAMQKLSADINTKRLKLIIQKINDRLPQVKQELEKAEQALEQYDRKERPAILAAENGSLLSAVTTSEVAQRQIRLTLTGIAAQIHSLQEKLGLSTNQAYVSSALSADPIMINLRSQIYQTEGQIALLTKRGAKPEYPERDQLQRNLDVFNQQLQQRAVEVVGGGGKAAPLASNVTGIRNQSSLDPARQQLANQLVALQTQQETLQKQLVDLEKDDARLRQDYSQVPNKQLQRSRLEQQVLLKRTIFDQMQAKLTDAKTAEAETVSSLSIARVPLVIPAGRPPLGVPLTLGVGVLLGLLVGGGVIFLLGSLEGSFKTKEDIRSSLKEREIPLLGEIPLLPVDNLFPGALPVIFSADSLYLEFYEKFRSNLRRIGTKSLKVVMIASTSSSEGKTTTAYNLAIACARAGKRTLIIETDLRSPSYSSSLKVTPDLDATVEPLRYYASLSDCVRLVPDVENLYIIPSPGPVRQSAAVLESSEMRRLIEDARERFDIVILDTNPLGLSNDALLIQPYSDGIILLARPNYTQENVFAEAIDQMVEAELGLLGGVINGADITVSLPPSVVNSPSYPSEEQLSARMRRN